MTIITQSSYLDIILHAETDSEKILTLNCHLTLFMEVEGQKRRFQGQTPKLRTKLVLLPARGFSGMLKPFSMADYR